MVRWILTRKVAGVNYNETLYFKKSFRYYLKNYPGLKYLKNYPGLKL